MSVYEYEIACDCGVTFRVGLTVPAETVDDASLGRVLTALHPAPLCDGVAPARIVADEATP